MKIDVHAKTLQHSFNEIHHSLMMSDKIKKETLTEKDTLNLFFTIEESLKFEKKIMKQNGTQILNLYRH